jgi:16S rRNA (uracil1498-N3)-methyltransferase
LSQLQRIAIAPSQRTETQIILTSEQQHYLGNVLRLRGGDRFIAMDGQGHWWLSQLSTALNEAQILEAVEIHTELPIPVLLLIAMPKGNGMDEIVRQATELGVTDIVPLISDRTLLNPSPQKLDRWRRIIQEAAEQSERQIIPTLHAPVNFPDALKTWNSANSTCFLCEARDHHPHLLTLLSSSTLPTSPIILTIGPEGGWTETEIQQAIAAGYQPVSLGRRILRAVTAPIVALTVITSVFESIPQPSETV